MNRLNGILDNDNMLLQKIGLAVGAVAGLLIGMIVSQKADDFDYILSEELELEEGEDGPEED